MKHVASLAIAVFLLVALSSLASASGVPAGLTQIPPVNCTGDEDLVIENRYIKTTGDGIRVSGNCTLELINSHVVADGYAVLVEYNGTANIYGSTIEGGKAAFRVIGNGDVYYENSHVRGKLQTSMNGEIEDGGNNTQEGASERVAAGLGDSGMAETVALLEDWRVHTQGEVYDLAAVLAELGAVADGDRLRLNLAGDVLFDFDSDVIRPSAAVKLAKVAQVLRQRAVGEIMLEGHTDSVGSPQYNQSLSMARAAAVRLWLHEKEAIPLELMVARGWGEDKPVAYNTMPDGSDNPAGRAENRRVEISFVSSETVVSPQTASLEINAGGVTLRGAAAAPEVNLERQPVDDTEPPGACAQFCNRWSELTDTQISCVTSALLLSGFGVYDHNACLAVDSTAQCKLCWQKLQVSEEDCAKLSRLCVGR